MIFCNKGKIKTSTTQNISDINSCLNTNTESQKINENTLLKTKKMPPKLAATSEISANEKAGL